ncbi:MAG: mononuclear molybdenum enzyme YedY, partial [Methylobacter sp.]
MLIKTKSNILSSEITDRAVFESRREFIKAATIFSAGIMLPSSGHAETGKYADVPVGPYSAKLPVTGREDVTSYTNYYEFSSNKKDSTVLARALKTKPWSVEVAGEVEKPGVY